MQWMAFGFATPVVVYGGWVFIRGAFEALRSRKLDMSVLITTGVAAAYLFSAGITLSGGHEVFFEAAAMLITFVLFGHWMEMKSRRGTTDALRALLALVPERAIVVRDGVEVEVDTADVVSGDLVRIRAGQRVPVDGVIESGTSSLDESLVSGESLPVERSAGDELVAGSVNGEGALLIRASGTGSETVLGRIIALVQNAQASKAPASVSPTGPQRCWLWSPSVQGGDLRCLERILDRERPHGVDLCNLSHRDCLPGCARARHANRRGSRHRPRGTPQGAH